MLDDAVTQGQNVSQTPLTTTLPVIIVEMFPIQSSIIPKLTAYHVKIDDGTLATIGGKVAYRCNAFFPGHWLWSDHHLITNRPVPEEQFLPMITTLWEQHPEDFRGLISIHADHQWQQTTQVEADFVARCLCSTFEVQQEILHRLQSYDEKLNSQVKVRRTYEIRGWDVQGQPSLSLSVSSQVLSSMDLHIYTRQLSDNEQLKGLLVMDKRKGFKGEITEIRGTLEKERERLLRLTQDDVTKKIIQQASKDELVVHIQTRGNNRGYDYIASTLTIVIRIADGPRFGISPALLLRSLRMAPQIRFEMVKRISRYLQQCGLIRTAYISNQHKDLFLNGSVLGFPSPLIVGNQYQVAGEASLIESLHQHGFYRRHEQCPEGAKMNIGVINGVAPLIARAFMDKLSKECHNLKFDTNIRMITVSSPARHDFEQAIERFREHNIHALLAFFPDTPQWQNNREDPYYHFKSLTIGQDIVSQVVYASTFSKIGAATNVALGLLSKLGNVPFRLAYPLPYADIIVGIDIARRIKGTLSGTVNALATAQIYQDADATIRYFIQDAQLDGETIPKHVLQSLFPRTLFAGKRVLIHRDGIFRGQERQDLKAWAQIIGATFYLVEVIKSGAPRLYHWLPSVANETSQMKHSSPSSRIAPPVKGTAFRLNGHEAFLISSLPPFQHAMPQPLHIRSEAPLHIEEALHSVLTMTLLHYGSLQLPRLPITTHYSDKIATLLLKGIRPSQREGSLPYWL